MDEYAIPRSSQWGGSTLGSRVGRANRRGETCILWVWMDPSQGQSQRPVKIRNAKSAGSGNCRKAREGEEGWVSGSTRLWVSSGVPPSVSSLLLLRTRTPTVTNGRPPRDPVQREVGVEIHSEC